MNLPLRTIAFLSQLLVGWFALVADAQNPWYRTPVAEELPTPPPSAAAAAHVGDDVWAEGSWIEVPATAAGFDEAKPIYGVNADSCVPRDREALWKDQHVIPWESFAYGEYVGPFRTPHVGEYRLRVNDQLEFTFFQVRNPTSDPYRLYVGDSIQVTSPDPDLNQTNLTILPDGTISLRQIGVVRAAGQSIDQLSRELNLRYQQDGGVRNPQIVVQVLQAETPLRDIRDAVDARQGVGGQTKQATVTPDGTIQLPLINSVPALGLTLDELGREINARYQQHVRGLDVTAQLIAPAPRYIYVLGEVNQPGRIELNSPTTAIQAISQAGGWKQGGNLRQIVVFRRDQNWRLMATRLNLTGALAGSRPLPSDEIWLRDSDVVLVPKTRIQRVSELVDLYFTRTIYGVFRIWSYDFLFDGSSTIVN